MKIALHLPRRSNEPFVEIGMEREKWRIVIVVTPTALRDLL